jgi:hypothetical protein
MDEGCVTPDMVGTGFGAWPISGVAASVNATAMAAAAADAAARGEITFLCAAAADAAAPGKDSSDIRGCCRSPDSRKICSRMADVKGALRAPRSGLGPLTSVIREIRSLPRYSLLSRPVPSIFSLFSFLSSLFFLRNISLLFFSLAFSPYWNFKCTPSDSFR